MSDFIHPSDLDAIYNDIYGEYLIDGGGEFTWDRSMGENSTTSYVDGRMYLTGFKCKRSETITQIEFYSGANAAVGGTVRRVGIYARRSDNVNYDLVASLPNDLTLAGTINTTYVKTLSQPFYKIRGQEYAVATLLVGSSPVGCFQTASLSNSGTFAGACLRRHVSPLRGGQLNGQTDLPASFNISAITSVITYQPPAVILLP